MRRILGGLIVAVLALLLTPAPALANKWLAWLEELSGPGPYDGFQLTADILCAGSKPDVVLTRAADDDPDLLASVYRCRKDRSNNILTLHAEYASYSDASQDERAYPGTTRLKRFAVIGYFPVERVFTIVKPKAWRAPVSPYLRWAEVGTGIGMYGVFGSDVLRDKDYWRGAVPLRVRFLPGELFYIRANREAALTASDEGRQRVDLRRDLERRFSWRRAAQSLQVMVGGDLVIGSLDRQSFDPDELQKPYGKNEFVPTHSMLYVDLGMLIRAFVNR